MHKPLLNSYIATFYRFDDIVFLSFQTLLLWLLIMALVLKVQKSNDRRKQYNTHYDAIYDVLIYLSRYPIPLTKHRISTNKNVLSSLLSKQLISPVTDKDLLINNKYENVTHYVISQKGIQYIIRYESLQKLLVD